LKSKKSFGCQCVFQTEVSNAATQTTGYYQYFSSEPEECFEVDTNEADETDPSANICYHHKQENISTIRTHH
jgi:hypothetical protein